ncbi:MAG: LptF/LptG family permease, partial [Phycisphaerae bacterium]|nr:LptF/LptG family permease [Phycisphaerae bacterium]
LSGVITALRAKWNDQKRGWDLETQGKRIDIEGALVGGLTAEMQLKQVPYTFYPTELTPEKLVARRTAQWMQFASLPELNGLLQLPEGDVNKLEIEKIKHNRFTLPITNMIMLLLGLSFFLVRLPGKMLTQGAKALGACSLAFIVTFIGQQMLGTANVSPALPAWLPIFLFLPVMALLMDNVKT